MNKRLFQTIILIATCACVMFSAFSIVSINSAGSALKEAIIGKCANETVKSANKMSTALENAEGTVNMLAASAYSSFDMEQYEKNPQYMDEYIASFDTAIKTALADLENTVGLFYTLNVDMVNQKEGYEIWYVYDDEGNIQFLDAAENGVFLEAFEDVNAGYMQYYFQSVAKHGEEGVWVGPVYDPDIKKNILSYARAVFVDDTFIGVVGMDLSTKNTTDMIMSIELESQGDIALFNQQGQSIVDSFSKEDAALRRTLGSMLSDENSAIRKETSGVSQKTVGEEKVLITYANLSNDWILVVTHNRDEIFSTVTFVSTTIAVLAITVGALLIFLLYFILKRYNTPYEEAMHLLKIMELDSNLPEEEREAIQDEDDIKDLVKKYMVIQRNKDIMIAHQSRLAQTGEIMTGIAHQWKQPLNNINLIQGNLMDEYLHGEMTNESLEEAVMKTQQQTRFMSETIDNFNKYLKPEEAPSLFTVDEVIKGVLMLLKDSFKKNKIDLDVDLNETIEFMGYPNALYQVVLNVMTNAIDALKTVPAEERLITVLLENLEDRVVIRISNSGEQIPEEIKNQIFKPYFTTKGKAGTGLGLSISRSILEKNMKGTIDLENEEKGVLCTIILPKGAQHGE